MPAALPPAPGPSEYGAPGCCSLLRTPPVPPPGFIKSPYGSIQTFIQTRGQNQRREKVCSKVQNCFRPINDKILSERLFLVWVQNKRCCKQCCPGITACDKIISIIQGTFSKTSILFWWYWTQMKCMHCTEVFQFMRDSIIQSIECLYVTASAWDRREQVNW